MKTKISLNKAEEKAREIIEILLPVCKRVEIAGSIRRRKPLVGDIEICALPITEEVPNLFSELIMTSSLDGFDYSQIGKVLVGGATTINGRYKKIQLNGSDICLDLFIVLPPAQWGVIFMIRTGSDEFSHKMVTRRNLGGYLPSSCKVKDGVIYKWGEPLNTPEEQDWFDLCEMNYVKPEERKNEDKNYRNNGR